MAAFREVGRIAVFAARVLVACVTPVIYVRELLRQCLRIGFYSLPVVGLTAVFIGAALALNIYVGGSRFNAEQFVPNIVVLGITRELGPVLAGLMLAGRVSAGIAAEIGTMRVTEQIDALLTLSTKPERYLYAPRVLAATLTLPLLVLVADIIGVMGGYLVGVNSLDFNGALYLRNTWAFVTASDIWSGVIKARRVRLHHRAHGLLSGRPLERRRRRRRPRGDARRRRRGRADPRLQLHPHLDLHEHRPVRGRSDQRSDPRTEERPQALRRQAGAARRRPRRSRPASRWSSSAARAPASR